MGRRRDLFEQRDRHRCASSLARDDDGVGAPAEQHIVRGLTGGERHERRGVFDQDVGEEPEVIGAEALAVPQRRGSFALDEALIGDVRAHVDVDPHERGAGHRRDAQRGERVVAEAVHADGQPGRGDDRLHEHRHRRHLVRGQAVAFAALEEGRRAEVLDDDRRHAPCAEGLGVAEREAFDAREIVARVARITRQSGEMHDADDAAGDSAGGGACRGGAHRAYPATTARPGHATSRGP